MVLGTHLEPDNQWEPISANLNVGEGTNVEAPQSNILNRFVRSTVGDFVEATPESLAASSTSESSMLAKLQQLPGLVKDSLSSGENGNNNSGESTSTLASLLSVFSSSSTSTAAPTTTTTTATTTVASTTAASILNNLYQTFGVRNTTTVESSFESLDSLFPEALTAVAGDASITVNSTMNGTSCGRVNIMGTIVNDSAPYLYPFVIEYSLIGAVVIYVIWRQIGRYPR